MRGTLQGKTVAFLVADGFNFREVQTARRFLRGAGAWVDVIAPKRGWIIGGPGVFDGIVADFSAPTSRADDFDALYIPGGRCYRALQQNNHILDLLRECLNLGHPVVAVGQAVGVILSAGVARYRRLTSPPAHLLGSLAAGADWRDLPVVRHKSLVTAQSSEHVERVLPAFVKAFGTESFLQPTREMLAR